MVLQVWVDHFSLMMESHILSSYPYFYTRLYQRSIVVSERCSCMLSSVRTCTQVFHWAWISAVVAAQFHLPISPYVIDGKAFPSPLPRSTLHSILGHSDETAKRAYTQPDGAEEDADRTLLSTPRSIRIHPARRPNQSDTTRRASRLSLPPLESARS